MKERLTVRNPEGQKKSLQTHSPKSAVSISISSPIDRVLSLQRTIGNRAVERLIKSGAMHARLSQPGDIYEQEADRVADAVVIASLPLPRKCAAQCTKDDEKEQAQRKTISDTAGASVRENFIHNISAGQPLQFKSSSSYTSSPGTHDTCSTLPHFWSITLLSKDESSAEYSAYGELFATTFALP